jgi:rRNA processing protein Krr1/Pno1
LLLYDLNEKKNECQITLNESRFVVEIDAAKRDETSIASFSHASNAILRSFGTCVCMTLNDFTTTIFIIVVLQQTN